MKAFKIFSMAAVAFMMVACSSEDEALDNTPVAGRKVHFTATIAAPGSDASTRTTYTEVTSGTDAGKIKVAWEQGDEIALIHNGKKDVVTVQTLNADGSANISGDITVGTDGEAVTIVYPAASVNAPTSGAEPVEDATYATKWNSQDGTLTYIQDNLDFCRATSTLKVSGTNATLSDNIALKSTIAIFKFTTKNYDASASIDVKPLTVTIGTQDYVINPATATSTLYVALPAVSSQTVSFSGTVGSMPYVCSKTGVSFEAGNFYQSILKLLPQGAIPGRFTINAGGDKVYFSQGNLQAVIASGPTDTYNYTASSWKFAEHQWDYIGNAAGNNSFAVGSTVDLFGWVGTSASYNTYGLCTQKLGNNDFDDYYGNSTSDALKSDWGDLAITNGGKTANSGWRTLKSDEWTYLINTRTVNGGTGNGKSYTLGQSVDGKLGIVIYPDDYTGVAYTTGIDWSTFETAGCVFLPAAGYRDGVSVYNTGTYGYYWSSSPHEYASFANEADFYSGYLNPDSGGSRDCGSSVRLVRDAE